MKRRVIAAWIVYDIAVHGYGLMIPAVGFAVYFTSFVAAGHPFADALWSVAIAVPLIAAGLLSPWLGIVADSGGRRRLLLVVVTLVCAVASALMRWVGQGDVAAGMALFFVAQLGFLLATALYNSYLPLISTPRNAARISGLGWVGDPGGCGSRRQGGAPPVRRRRRWPALRQHPLTATVAVLPAPGGGRRSPPPSRRHYAGASR